MLGQRAEKVMEHAYFTIFMFDVYKKDGKNVEHNSITDRDNRQY